MTKRRKNEKATMPALRTKQLVAMFRARLGQRPPSCTLPGLSVNETYRFYLTLGTVARAMGIRY